VFAGITRGIATLTLIKFEYDLAIDNIGAKNWPKQRSDQLWSWVISHLDRIYTSIKPDTIGFWEATFTVSLSPVIRSTSSNPFIRHYWKAEIRDVSLLYRSGYSHYHSISMAILHLRVCRNHTNALWYLTSFVSDEITYNSWVLLGQCRISGCSLTRPIFCPSPWGDGCQLRRGSHL